MATLIEQHAGYNPAHRLRNSCLTATELPSVLLNLAVLLIRDNPGTFTPEMLGETPAEVERRFLRSSIPNTCAPCRPRSGDGVRSLIFDFCAHAATLKVTISPGWWVITGPSSCPRGDRPGFHGFHRHMQASLICEPTAFRRYTAGAETRSPSSRGSCNDCTSIGPRTSARCRKLPCPTPWISARTYVADGLLDRTAVARPPELDSGFDSLQAASLRRPFLD